MSDAKEVRTIVITRNAGTLRGPLLGVLTWAVLCAGVYCVHAYAGGSWVLDLLVVTLGITASVMASQQISGQTTKMTPSEIRAWVAADMPLAAREWVAAYRWSRGTIPPGTVRQ